MAQHWVWHFQRGKKNLERVDSQRELGLLHDVGFGGDKTYKPVKIGSGMSAVLIGAPTFYKRSEALAWLKKEATQRNPSKSVKVMGHTVKIGSKKHKILTQQKKHCDDLLKSETSRKNPSKPIQIQFQASTLADAKRILKKLGLRKTK